MNGEYRRPRGVLHSELRIGLSADRHGLGGDLVLPCATDSARRRHLTRTENCGVCGVDGAVPEYVWWRRYTESGEG